MGMGLLAAAGWPDSFVGSRNGEVILRNPGHG